MLPPLYRWLTDGKIDKRYLGKNFMSVVVITGSAGLIGSEAAYHFGRMGFDVVGIDNNMREVFFGEDASNRWNVQWLQKTLGKHYTHVDEDIRNLEAVTAVFRRYQHDIKLVIHAAAQPSHDWAAQAPLTDFAINANGTLNLLETTRLYASDAVFIFTSTNKVYGDTPNQLPFEELDLRWELPTDHPFWNGVPESMSIDRALHSVFGASKVAADVLTQEYGRYYGLYTGCFRCGCLTGPHHSGTRLHGFLAYLLKCTVLRKPYTVLGYKGKQVRDNIHSADLINAFEAFFQAPRIGEVYNMGGGRLSNCSLLEAIQMCEAIADTPLNWTYSDQNRLGDHIWWISDLRRFRAHYPNWQQQYDMQRTLREMYEALIDRYGEDSS